MMKEKRKVEFSDRFVNILSFDSKASEQVKFNKTGRNIGIFVLLIILGNLFFELSYGIKPDISTCVIIIILIVILIVLQKNIHLLLNEEKK